MTDKSTKRRNAIIAAVAGAALLMGGSTYALWSQTVDITSGAITTGDLALEADAMQVFDASSDSTSTSKTIELFETETFSITGDSITLGSWKMVPGDTVAMIFPYKVTLDGDNLFGKLTVDCASIMALFGQDGPDETVTLEYATYDGTSHGKALSARNPVTAGSLTVGEFSSATSLAAFVLYVTLDADELVNTDTILASAQEVSATLEQIRR